MARRTQKTQQIETTIQNAVADAVSELETLASEMRDWYDNMPENLQGGDKGGRVEEAASTLEDISEPDVESWLGDHTMFYVASAKMPRSRPARRDQAVAMLYAVVETLDDFIDDMRDDDEDRADDTQCDRVNDAEELRDEVQEIIDTAESVEFPGMFG